MNILEYMKDHLLYLDGGMGTQLQAKGMRAGELPERRNLTHPDDVVDIHQAYFDAGSNVVSTNTFGANCLKFNDDELSEIIRAAVANAHRAASLSTGTQKKFIALDIGPLGKLLKPYGDLDFEEAVAIFAKTVRLGAACDVDLIIIETMNDSYETKAALLAAKENSDLPVFVSNAYGADGKLMTGSDPAAMIAMLEGMGADAIGINCSLGPEQMTGVVEKYLQYSSLPVLVKPNAGLPRCEDGKTFYDVTPDRFAALMADFVRAGVRIVGGCCGTTPAYIDALHRQTADISPVPVCNQKRTMISSYTHAVVLGEQPVLIGERIAPTENAALCEALRDGDVDYILDEAMEQKSMGVQLLDINVSLPDIDEAAMLTEAVGELQAILDIPLVIGTADPVAMDKALRIYNGKAAVYLVGGEEGVMHRVFPSVKKYGAVVFCLTAEKNNIPKDAEGGARIAEKITATAAQYGISPKDLVFDAFCENYIKKVDS